MLNMSMGPFYKYLERRVAPRLRNLVESLNNKELDPFTIGDFYWLWTGLSYNQIPDEEIQIAQHYLREIQQIYIAAFTELLTQQIEKYVQRGRVDMAQGKPAFDVRQIRAAPLDSRPALIKSMMAKTFRSDMKRRNDVWDQIADHLQNLATTGVIDKICYYIDRINNSVHNTKTLVLDKFENGAAILQALDAVHNARRPTEYARFVEPEVRKLVRNWFGPGMR